MVDINENLPLNIFSREAQIFLARRVIDAWNRGEFSKGFAEGGKGAVVVFQDCLQVAVTQSRNAVKEDAHFLPAVSFLRQKRTGPGSSSSSDQKDAPKEGVRPSLRFFLLKSQKKGETMQQKPLALQQTGSPAKPFSKS